MKAFKSRTPGRDAHPYGKPGILLLGAFYMPKRKEVHG